MHSLEFHGFETLNTVVGNGHIIECPDFDTITLFWPSFETVTHLCVPVLLIAVFRIRVFSRIRIRRFFLSLDRPKNRIMSGKIWIRKKKS